MPARFSLLRGSLDWRAVRRPLPGPAGLHLWLVTILLFLVIPLRLREPVTNAAVAPVPTFQPPPGFYDHDVLLRLSTVSAQASILFTMDGSVPTIDNGTPYDGPIPFAVDEPRLHVVRARALLPDGRLGPVVTASYALGLQAELPVVSLVADPADLWHPRRGIYANPSQRGREWERPVDLTYFTPAPAAAQGTANGLRQVGFQVPAGLRIHGSATRTYAKQSLRLYFRETYGLNRLEYPLFSDRPGGDQYASFKRLVLHDGGQDFAAPKYGVNWTLMRTQLMYNLASHVDGFTTQSRPVLLFLNGQLQGVYQLRNFIDEDFLADKYGVEPAALIGPQRDINPAVSFDTDPRELLTPRMRWEQVLRFLEAHDLRDPAHYEYLASQIDIPNFIDYHILQIYATNYDWMYNNMKQFRPVTQGGAWRWLFWDIDYGFGLAPWSSYEFDMVDYVLVEDRPFFEAGARPFRTLIANPRFRQAFLSRAADLLNSLLSPGQVQPQIEALAREMRHDIEYEVRRWTSPSDWHTSVDEMLDFARFRPDALRQHLVQHFGLAGVAQYTFLPPSNGHGSLAVNGFLLPDSAWQGHYFQGTRVSITAVPAPGYRFAGWEGRAKTAGSASLDLVVEDALTFQPRFEVAAGDMPRAGDVIIIAAGSERQVHPQYPIKGDWLTLRVTRSPGVDLRGWRITDNDTKLAGDEGSLILPWADALVAVPDGTTILVIATETPANDQLFNHDDLDARDGQLLFYVGNGHLDAASDPWFNLGAADNVVLLAPGPSADSGDDVGIDFLSLQERASTTGSVTPHTFGILTDGVVNGMPLMPGASDVDSAIPDTPYAH